MISAQLRERASSDTATTVIVTLVSALSLLLLSVAVFSLAATTRNLSEHAASLHTTNEAIRSATTARAQIAIAVHGARVDRALGSDSSAAVGASLEDARLALADFSQASSLLGDSAETAPFVDAATRSIDSIQQSTSQVERDQNDARLSEVFQPLMTRLVERRNELLADVEKSDRQMGTLGNLASFVVAFMLPTAAIFIYQQLARRPRHVAETSRRAEEVHDRQRDAANFSGGIAERVDAALVAGDATIIARRSRELASATRLLTGGYRFRIERAGIGDILSDVARAFQNEAITVGVRPTEAVGLFDRKAVRTALELLVEHAMGRSATMATLEVRTTDAALDVAVWTNSRPLALNQTRRVFLEAGRMEDAADEEIGLLLHARALVEGTGGELIHRTTNDRDGFSIVFPQVLAQVTAAEATEDAVVGLDS